MVLLLFLKPMNSLTSVKFLNWVCSRFLAVAFSSLQSMSEEFLKIRAAVAMAFSRSEPFPRAVGGEMHNDIAQVRNTLSQDMEFVLQGNCVGIGLESVCQPDSVLGLFIFYWESDLDL